MKKDFDVKKIRKEMKKAVDKARDGLKKMGRETTTLAKRSEKELSRITKIGKANFYHVTAI